MTAVCGGTQTAEGALRNGWLFSACPEPEIQDIAGLCAQMNVPAGGTLITEDTQHHSCYVVVQGEAVLTRGGREIGRAAEGAIVGVGALIDDGATNVAAVAVSDMCVLALTRERLGQYLSQGGWSVRHRLDVMASERQRPALEASQAA